MVNKRGKRKVIIMHDSEILLKELGGKLPEGKGCINFDFACLFPYDNQEVLTFEFGLGEEEIGSQKHNHRYPNRNYVTISKKLGRKVSKIGFPLLVDLNDEQLMILWIKVVIKDKVVKLVFPVKITVTKDEPVATLEGHFNFDKSRFTFITYKYVSDGGWEQIVWTNDLEYVDDPRVTIMSNVFIDKDNSTAIYHTPITLASQPLENCLVSLT